MPTRRTPIINREVATGRNMNKRDGFIAKLNPTGSALLISTQQVGDEKISVLQSRISVVPYVLPHISKVSPEKHEKAAGPKGWNFHQGFYVYRNERLLVPGDWLGPC